jgi:prophage DNA circulation protein
VTGYSQQIITAINSVMTAIASIGLAAEAHLDGSAMAPMTASLLNQIVIAPVPGAGSAAISAVSPVAVAGMTPISARQIGSVSTIASRAEQSPVPGVTASRVQMAINQVTLMDLVRQSALAQAAQAVASSSFGTVSAAQAAMNDVAQRLDLEMQLTCDAGVYQALSSVRVAMVQAVNATIANLPRIGTIVLPRSAPALVLAYRLYDDPSRADQIVTLNDVPHPGFLPAGIALEVTVDE